MILLYRITPFLIAFISAITYGLFLGRVWHPIAVVTAGVCAVALLLGRLLKWRVSDFSFWFFLGIGSVFFLSSFGMLFLFEAPIVSILVACLSGALLVLFSEFVFLYVHLPSQYQPFSLEYLTSLLNLLAVFFFSSFAFATRLLVLARLSVLAFACFFLSFFLVYGMLWVTKAETFKSTLYALFGAIVLTELFLALSFFPTGFYTNAACMTIFCYAFFGLTRTEALHKLSKEVLQRYLVTASTLLLLVFVSSKWL